MGLHFHRAAPRRGACVSQPRPGGSLRPQPAWPRGQRKDWPRPHGGQGQSCPGRACALSPWAVGLHAEAWTSPAPVAGLPLLQGSLCGQLSQSAVSASLKGSERLPEEKARWFLEEDLSRPATQPQPCPVPQRREEAASRGSHLGPEDRARPNLHALHTHHWNPEGPTEAPQSPVLRPPCRWPQVNKGMRVKAQQSTSRPTDGRCADTRRQVWWWPPCVWLGHRRAGQTAAVSQVPGVSAGLRVPTSVSSSFSRGDSPRVSVRHQLPSGGRGGGLEGKAARPYLYLSLGARASSSESALPSRNPWNPESHGPDRCLQLIQVRLPWAPGVMQGTHTLSLWIPHEEGSKAHPPCR